MTTALVFQGLGGLALFLLAMQMMTNGLKAFAGPQLRNLLGNWTRTPLRGLAAGALITAVVQSSGAVTVATIGFVNAGLLSLKHALSVVFGSNVGTTMTGWLVSLVGFGFNVERVALPILTAGVAMKLMAGSHRLQSLGESLAGFGLFFLGLGLLQSTFGSAAQGSEAQALLANSYHPLVFLGIGFGLTVVTQSSSAALAMVLTAAAGGLLQLESAAAAVIGANLGSTSTAAFATIGATANARRLAVGHIGFNAVTGLIALVMLPAMLWLVNALARWLTLEASPAISLALFHTLFNIFGAAMMLPFAPRIAHYLGRLFRSAEEDNARPRHLDDTLVSTPELAVSALGQEMKRLYGLVNGVLRAALHREDLKPALLTPQIESCQQLNQAITDYVAKVRAEKLPDDLVEQLTWVVRTCRYLSDAVTLAGHLLAVRSAGQELAGGPLAADMKHFIDLLAAAMDPHTVPEQLLDEAEPVYQALKAGLLNLMVRRAVSIPQGEAVLDDLSASRRLLHQWLKATRLRPQVTR
ncbi:MULTISPECIES: Na/Pi cotransporter family protein [Marinobacter]|uniref:Na/Pi cotransporter n=1 Tax=Marinobacter profundi TaxID=2666256 RepID=A0A2G1UHE5_9GAMM|nr:MULTISPECIES: Na/Pi symporter [Marinobacter]MBD3657530.1 Na/Pi cotransporter family protein [Marinobacter sp.]PHQ13865.1 Na/Pi cotransporter [Marinobacter profundi]